MNRLTRILAVAMLVPFALPGAAFAQTSALSVSLTNPALVNLSRTDCTATDQDDLVVTWTRTLLAGENERVFISTTDTCTGAEESELKVLVPLRERTQATSTTLTNPISVAELFALATDTTDCGGAAGIDKNVFFCVVVTGAAIPAGSPVVAKVTVNLDTKPPPVPSDVKATSRENGLLVTWAMPDELDGATSFKVTATHPTTGAVVERRFEGANTRQGTLDGLENNVTFGVQVSSIDDAGSTINTGNESAPSAPVPGTPQAVEDFWELYKADGGQETGGCASFGVTGLALLGALALLRRRRGAAAALVVLAASSVAEAQPVEPLDVLRSPQRFSFEVKTGPYEPNIDDEAALQGRQPYQTIFQDQTSWLWRAEFDIDLWRGFGRLGLGVSGGYWSIAGSGILPSGDRSDDEVRLNVVPITPLLYYRADFLYTQFGIPLSPYLKAGYGFVWWNSTVNGDESVATVNGQQLTAKGWARGVELTGGLTFILDVIEPDKAAALDQDFGINSTGIFVEGSYLGWEGNTGLRLDGWTVAGGLLLAF